MQTKLAKAVRKFCIECSLGAKEADKCNMKQCQLWEFRHGIKEVRMEFKDNMQRG